jgi:hypothetical protein
MARQSKPRPRRLIEKHPELSPSFFGSGLEPRLAATTMCRARWLTPRAGARRRARRNPLPNAARQRPQARGLQLLCAFHRWTGCIVLSVIAASPNAKHPSLTSPKASVRFRATVWKKTKEKGIGKDRTIPTAGRFPFRTRLCPRDRRSHRPPRACVREPTQRGRTQ